MKKFICIIITVTLLLASCCGCVRVKGDYQDSQFKIIKRCADYYNRHINIVYDVDTLVVYYYTQSDYGGLISPYYITSDEEVVPHVAMYNIKTNSIY